MWQRLSGQGENRSVDRPEHDSRGLLGGRWTSRISDLWEFCAPHHDLGTGFVGNAGNQIKRARKLTFSRLDRALEEPWRTLGYVGRA